MKIFNRLLFVSFIILLGAGQIFAEEKQEELFYNPKFSQILKVEEEVLEYMPFVIKNYFIRDGKNDRSIVDYEHKFELNAGEIELIQYNTDRIRIIVQECGELLNYYKDIFPLEADKRQAACGYLAEKLEECVKLELEICGNENLLVESILFRNFKPFTDWEERVNEGGHSKEYYSYMRGVEHWYNKFQDIFLDINKKLEHYYYTEYVLSIFESRGFILKGNVNSRGEFAPYIYKAIEAAGFHFIKPDGSGPLSSKEMKALDCKNPDDLNKISWKAFIPKDSNVFIGIVFRDNPAINSSATEIMEFYNLGIIQEPSNLLELAMTKMPLEIRWVDSTGRFHIMWCPTMFSPIEYFPMLKGDLE